MINGLDLFTGIGGITVALNEWVTPVCYCEIEPYCQSVLLQRMQEGDLPKAPIWDDVRSLSKGIIGEPIDIIYGGSPCQGFSVAGHGKGLEDERSGLFFEIMRLAKEIKPRFIFLENVPAITSRGGLRVVREITSMGYDCRWCIISAASVGAMHRRKRWFLLAHAIDNGKPTSERGESSRERPLSREGQEEQAESVGETQRTGGLSSDVANTNRMWKSQCKRNEQDKWQWTSNSSEDVANSLCERLERQRGGTQCEKEKQPEIGRAHV